MNKSDIVHLLAARFGYRRYLELRTPFTGPDCVVDEKRFAKVTRIQYQTPIAPSGVPRENCLAQIAANSFGIALLDPWHSHAQSYRDMEEVFALLAPGGAMLVHDCWPPQDIIGASPQGRLWSGETYAAYIDFVTGRTDLNYLTVDCDYGCGIVFKQVGPPPDPALVAGWREHHNYHWLQGEGRVLLRLVSAEAFARSFGERGANGAQTKSSALIVVCVNPEAPFHIEIDSKPEFHLGFFDYTGNGYVPRISRQADLCVSHKTAGKGEVLVHLAAQDLGDFDFIAVIDHDVLLSISAINRLLSVARQHKLDLFQPSLSHDSFISHPHLANRPGSLVRDTTFVEIMTPFFSAAAFGLVKDAFAESVSGWGLDLLLSSRVRQTQGKLAIVDAVIAKHLNPIQSHTWRFADGETPPGELQRILQRHNLIGYEIR